MSMSLDTALVPGVPVAQAIARFVTQLAVDRLPDEVRQAAIDRIVDVVGVAISGSATPTIRQLVAEFESDPAVAPGASATVWGTPARLTAPVAALLNAAAAHCEDFDDTHTASVVHGSACVVPAAFAAAEAYGASGERVLAAVVAGWEVATRIGLAAAGSFHRRGWHTTSVAGVFGATAAVACVRRLNEKQIVDALGIAGSAAGGINAYLQNGSQAKFANPAFAAHNALLAVGLARGGLTGPVEVFEGRHGVFEAFTEDVPDIRGQFTDLGDRWEILRVSTKPYPACHFAHATIEAVIELRHRGVTAEQVQELVCHLPPATFDLICRPWPEKLKPTTPYAVRFSLPWLAAMALIDGQITRTSFGPDCHQREDVQRVASLVRPREWSDSPFPSYFPGRVEARLTNGDQLTSEVLVNRGHPDRPLGPALDEKFLGCVRSAPLAASPEALLRTLRNLPGVADMRAVGRALSPVRDGEPLSAVLPGTVGT